MNCTKLRHIKLRDCYRLSDRSLIGLAAFCPTLEDIDMYAVDNLSNEGISNLDELCQFIRTLNVGGSEISDNQLQKLASKVHHCQKVKGKLMLEPLYRSRQTHLRHIQFMSFLHLNQRVLFCAVKAFFLRKRLRQRLHLQCQCRRIQYTYRNYRNRRVLKAIADIIREEMQTKAQMFQSARKIATFYHSLYQRKIYQLKRKACIILQRFFRRVLNKFKKKREIHSSVVLDMVACGLITDKFEEVNPTSTSTLEDQNIEGPSYNVLQKWESIVSKEVEKKAQRCKEQISVSMLQRFWKNKVSMKQQKERSVFLKRKYIRYLASLVKEKQNRDAIRLQAASTIQKHVRFKQKYDAIECLKMQEQKIKQERYDAALNVALHSQSLWRMKQATQILQALKRMRCSKNRAIIVIQSWWRSILCIFMKNHKMSILRRWKIFIYHKISIFQRWGRLVHLRMLKTKHSAAKLIQARFRYRREKEACRKIVRIVPILLSRRQLIKNFIWKKQCRAASVIQAHVRRLIIQNMIQKQNCAIRRLQKLWRSYSYHQMLKQIYVDKLKNLRKAERREANELHERRQLRMIQMVFLRTEIRAATIIQTRFRKFLFVLHKEEELRQRREEEQRKQAMEEERRQAFKARRDRKHDIKGVAKRCLDDAVSFFSDIKRGQLVKGTKQTIQHIFTKERSEKLNLTKEVIEYSMLRSRGVTKKSELIENFHRVIHEQLKGYCWFDKRCEKVIYSYALWPDQILQLNRIWAEKLDFQNKGKIWVDDFFDHVQEQRSAYGTSLFHVIQISTERYITFSEYIHVITYFSLLGKTDILKLVFKLKCKDSRAFLMKDEWGCLLDIMLSNEKIQYPKRGALQSFDRHASTDAHGTKILFFNDFQRILNEYPFIIVPMLRLQKKTREVHIGEKFWSKKSQDLHSAKASLKIIK